MKMDAFNTYMSNIPTDFFKSLCLKYGSAYGQRHRKGKVRVSGPVFTDFCRQVEITVEGILRVEVDSTVFEERIELLLRIPVLRVEPVNLVIRYVERFHVPFRLDNPCTAFLDGMVQQPVAHEIDKPVRRYSCPVFREKLRVFLDEGYDVIDFLFLCLETALAVRHHDELVATDTTAFAVHTHIRRITQTVTLVQMIARVNEYVLNVQSL